LIVRSLRVSAVLNEHLNQLCVVSEAARHAQNGEAFLESKPRNLNLAPCVNIGVALEQGRDEILPSSNHSKEQRSEAALALLAIVDRLKPHRSHPGSVWFLWRENAGPAEKCRCACMEHAEELEVTLG